jgi:hypothetical protein
MSLSGDGPVFEGVEEILLGQESSEEWLHFVSRSTPDYMYEHWQNSYEAQEEIDEYIEKRR